MLNYTQADLNIKLTYKYCLMIG